MIIVQEKEGFGKPYTVFREGFVQMGRGQPGDWDLKGNFGLTFAG
jgi:hypothetical protein